MIIFLGAPQNHPEKLVVTTPKICAKIIYPSSDK
jgi:hypothetical protein